MPFNKFGSFSDQAPTMSISYHESYVAKDSNNYIDLTTYDKCCYYKNKPGHAPKSIIEGVAMFLHLNTNDLNNRNLLYPVFTEAKELDAIKSKNNDSPKLEHFEFGINLESNSAEAFLSFLNLDRIKTFFPEDMIEAIRQTIISTPHLYGNRLKDLKELINDASKQEADIKKEEVFRKAEKFDDSEFMYDLGNYCASI